MAKDTYLKKVLGEDCYSNIRNTKVLMVGAGGIGCELLKDLVLTGYGEIHIVDLDTITLSNLNRQFLFRQKDIDKSKSLTVKEAVQSFNYLGAKLISHHGNIMDAKQFPIGWWNQFSYVLNALDNLEARRYVNKICLFTKTPLMESGTTGYDGQIQPIFPYVSECFECQAKATPKTYPVCTIRSTPSKPVHCITWAKEFLFQQLFDESKAELSEQGLQNETDDKKEIANLLKESNELNDLRKLLLKVEPKEFVKQMIVKIFQVDIERLLAIESLWKSRIKPEPLIFSDYEEDLNKLLADPKNEEILKKDTHVWNVLENFYVLAKSCGNLQKVLTTGSSSFISFDKDDEDTLNFVVAASNLRSAVFSIEMMSKFDIKQIAGNIIPAIATTNAIISGFSSIGALEYYKKNEQKESLDGSPTVFISIRPNKYITSAPLVGPSEKCASCALSSRGILSISKSQLSKLTLQDLINSIIHHYSYEEISIILGKSKLIYDYDFDDNAGKFLSDISGLSAGETLLIQDEEDKLENLELYIDIVENETADMLPDITIRPKKISTSNEEPSEQIPQVTNNSNDNTPIMIDDDVSIADDLIEISEPLSKKRKLD